MSESHHFYPLIGQHIHFYDSLVSTQDLALSWARNKSVTEGTIVRAGYQTAGRGQANNSWLAAENLNLTFSVVLYPEAYLTPTNTFYLSKWAAIAVYNALSPLLPAGLSIKWPNDLWFAEQKIGGILIQSSISGTAIQNAVVGIGINVNQVQFGNLMHATSLKQIIGEDHDLEKLMDQLIVHLNAQLATLYSKSFDQLDTEYLARLLGYQKKRSFRLPDGEIIQGIIAGIDEHGRLQLVYHDAVHVFGFKEIEWLVL